MRQTGVFLTQDELEQVQRLLQPKITMDFDKNINEVKTDPREATELLQSLAREKGLPDLPGLDGYGVTSDREIVAP